jgi:DNA invertase Pin-like site-specific DNA recombinase
MARKSRKHIEATPSPAASVQNYVAAGYVRLSAEDRKKKGDSIETQKAILENYIALQPDIHLRDFYVDNGTSGTTFDRPAFNKMLLDAERGVINCVIVKDLTRFGRNAIDAGYYLEKYLPALGVRFIAVTDDYDSNTGDGGILLPLKNIIAESYALDIGRKMRSALAQNIKEGKLIGRFAPYGYVKDPENHHKLLIDPEAASVVRRIFEWTLHGLKAVEVAKRLNEEGFPAPGAYKNKQGVLFNETQIGCGKWERGQVARILTDQVYAGDMVQGKSKCVNHRGVKTKPEEWVCVPDTHEAIVSRDDFGRAREIRNALSNRDSVWRQPHQAYSPNPFGAKVKCAVCGNALHRLRPIGYKECWFRCDTRWRYGKDACVQVSVKEDALIGEILAILQKHSETLRGRFIGADKRTSDDEASCRKLREISLEIDNSGRILKSLYENMVSGLITRAEFVDMKAHYESGLECLRERADDIHRARREAALRHTDINDISAAVADKTLTANLIDRLVDKILVSPDKSIEVFFRYGDEFREVCGQ